jgi:hypothetical protein
MLDVETFIFFRIFSLMSSHNAFIVSTLQLEYHRELGQLGVAFIKLQAQALALIHPLA